VSSIAHRGFVHLRKDVSKNSIAVAVLSSDRDAAEVDKIFHDTDSICRLIKRIGRPNGIWACYGAGPTGYDLQRLLPSMGCAATSRARSPGPAMPTSGASSVKLPGPTNSPNVDVGIRERQQGVPTETVARSWAAQVRLSKRSRQLATHKNLRSVVAAAIAREPAGFLAEMVTGA
jgi:hypothetical protein